MHYSFSKALLVLCFMALILINNSCTTTSISDVDGSDTVVYATIEASFPLDDSHDPLRIKINHTRANDGGFTQHLNSGQTINLPGQSFYGNDTLEGYFDISMTAFSLGVERPLSSDTVLGLYGGVATFKLDLELNSLVSNTSLHEGYSSPFLEVFWQKNHSAKFYSRVGISLAPALSENSNSYSALNLGIGYKLSKKLHLITGIRSLNYERNGTEPESGVLIYTNGPYLSLNFSL